MKKLSFGLIIAIMFSTFSFGQKKSTSARIATSGDPVNTNLYDQAISDNVDAAIVLLDDLKLNNPNYLNYEAVIHCSIIDGVELESSTVVSLIGTNITTSKKQHCQICGLMSAKRCVGQIRDSNLGNDYDIHVHNDGGGCVTLSW